MNRPGQFNAVRDPLGRASPDRYRHDSWPMALLQRVQQWGDRLHNGGRLLDLGCGEGALLARLKEKGFGADLNPERLALAVEKGLPVCRADALALPFADNTFRTVISMEVLEHIPDMAPVLDEVARVLEAGGSWLISVPSVTLRSRYEMWREGRPYYCDADEHYREFSPVKIRGFEHRFMLNSAFVDLLEKHGFRLIARDGVRFLFPQWLSRIPWLQRRLESPAADRLWTKLPWIRNYPYWTILVLRRSGV